MGRSRTPGVPKTFVSANELVRDSFRLARRIYDSGFRPDALLVIWRGGTPVGIVVHEFLLFKGLKTYHAVLKAEAYSGIGQRIEPRIEHTEAVLAKIRRGSRVLIIDDIFDTGATVRKVRELLAPKTRRVRIATLYRRADRKIPDLAPDYCLRETDRWIVFPHEIVGLSLEEIGRKDPVIRRLISGEEVRLNVQRSTSNVQREERAGVKRDLDSALDVEC